MSFSEYRGSEEFQIDQRTNEIYTVGGVTYNQDMVPIAFDESYTGPNNALAGSVVASNATEYGLYTTVNGINTELRTLDSSNNGQGDSALKRNEDGTWQVQPGYQDVIKDEDKTLAEDTYQEIIKDNSNFSNEEPTFEPGFISVGGEDDDASPQSASAIDLREEFKIGKVDHIIQKLALRNLIYPIDADYNTQDYMQINQFTYKPVNQKIFFPTEGDEAGPLRILREGVTNESTKEKHLGLVKLPMPNQLQDSNNVAWGQDQLNAITAAAAAGVFDATGDAVNLIRGLATGKKNFQDIVNEVKTRALNLGSNLAQAGRDAKGVVTSNDAAMLAQSAVGSFLLNVAQFGVTPETALARGAGVVPNSNMQLLFNAPTLREFTFNWRFTPRSQEEATRVKNIIRFFKQGMAVKKGNKTKSGSSKSFFLGTPNIFDIHFKTAKTGKYQILDRNDSVMRIKTCALTGVAVNYTPEGMWNAYEKGMPTSMLLSLRFGELEPIFDTDYEEDPFKYDTSYDVGSVPIDAIGY